MVVRVKPASAGFGLVEMLVVVAVLSVLAIGTSMLSLRGGSALPRTVDDLMADAAEARRLAMLSGLDHALIMSPDGWQMARRTGEGWSVLSARASPSVTLSGAVGPWVLSADGGVAALNLNLSHGDESRRCLAGPDRSLECQ